MNSPRISFNESFNPYCVLSGLGRNLLLPWVMSDYAKSCLDVLVWSVCNTQSGQVGQVRLVCFIFLYSQVRRDEVVSTLIRMIKCDVKLH